MTTGPESPQPSEPDQPTQPTQPTQPSRPDQPTGEQPAPPVGYPGPEYSAPQGFYPPPGYGQAPPPVGYPGQPPMRPEDEKLWAIAAQLGPILLGFLAPLIIWLVFKDRSRFLDRTAKESLNFQLTVLLGYLVSAVLTLVLIGILGFIVIGIGSFVLMIIAAVKVASFEDYRYPLTIRFIS
jgi:uncharacterized Tic20 family protein